MYWSGAQLDAREALASSETAERVIQTGIDHAPDDFLLAWRLSQILDRRRPLLAAEARAENAARLVRLWKTWVDRYPDSTFHRRQYRRAISMSSTPDTLDE